MINLKKNIDDQDFTEEEKRWVTDWLDSIAVGRLVVRVPTEAFGIPLGETCDREKVRALCEKVRIKPVTIIITPDERIIRPEGIVIP